MQSAGEEEMVPATDMLSQLSDRAGSSPPRNAETNVSLGMSPWASSSNQAHDSQEQQPHQSRDRSSKAEELVSKPASGTIKSRSKTSMPPTSSARGARRRAGGAGAGSSNIFRQEPKWSYVHASQGKYHVAHGSAVVGQPMEPPPPPSASERGAWGGRSAQDASFASAARASPPASPTHKTASGSFRRARPSPDNDLMIDMGTDAAAERSFSPPSQDTQLMASNAPHFPPRSTPPRAHVWSPYNSPQQQQQQQPLQVGRPSPQHHLPRNSARSRQGAARPVSSLGFRYDAPSWPHIPPPRNAPGPSLEGLVGRQPSEPSAAFRGMHVSARSGVVSRGAAARLGGDDRNRRVQSAHVGWQDARPKASTPMVLPVKKQTVQDVNQALTLELGHAGKKRASARPRSSVGVRPPPSPSDASAGVVHDLAPVPSALRVHGWAAHGDSPLWDSRIHLQVPAATADGEGAGAVAARPAASSAGSGSRHAADGHHQGPSRSGKERGDGGSASTFLGRAPPPRGSIYTTMERGDPVELARALPPTPAAMGAVLPTSKDFLPRKLRVKTFRHTAVPSRHYKVPTSEMLYANRCSRDAYILRPGSASSGQQAADAKLSENDVFQNMFESGVEPHVRKWVNGNKRVQQHANIASARRLGAGFLNVHDPRKQTVLDVIVGDIPPSVVNSLAHASTTPSAYTSLGGHNNEQAEDNVMELGGHQIANRMFAPSNSWLGSNEVLSSLDPEDS
mmetsp:Transcript_7982/g.15151  ORF Transcript_7982/g.15151 Transcript_7982/m.15151 type:complete len:736 (-) Transcript_7982:157-2364(-)